METYDELIYKTNFDIIIILLLLSLVFKSRMQKMYIPYKK